MRNFYQFITHSDLNNFYIYISSEKRLFKFKVHIKRLINFLLISIDVFFFIHFLKKYLENLENGSGIIIMY